MFSRFFIDRPIFASVLSMVITLAGAIALFSLPLAQYPQITPPTVQVSCVYPGADAQVVAETVAAPIEQQVNGVENMLYLFSQSTNDGQYNLTVTFENGVDLDMAQVLVQNRVNLALPLLPNVIKRTGVITKKKSPDILLAISLVSKDGRYDQLYLSNYAYLRVRDEITRIEGVGDVFIFGERDYSMRIWVDPDKLASRDLSASDVANAVREQNVAVALGQIGQPPALTGQQLQIPLTTIGRLEYAEQFGDIVLKTGSDGRVVRIKDVARVELGAKNIDVNASVNGMPSAALGIFQLPDANAFDTADRVRAKMQELAEDFPEGLEYVIRYDTTPFIRESIVEVVNTLEHAVLLVALVVLLFLQNWRSAVIPLIAVPVAIIGTFAVMAAFGFSLNHLTLFGLVLAIGIVVDDAIVVVEAVERQIEQGQSPREAALKAMEKVSAPVIAVGIVLSAVFVPCAFVSGITGQFFRQFALTIAASTLISTFNSLTLSPALAALILKPVASQKESGPPLPAAVYALLGAWLGWIVGGIFRPGEDQPVSSEFSWRTLLPYGCALIGVILGWLAARPMNFALTWIFRGFNRALEWSTAAYLHGVRSTLRHSVMALILYVCLIGITWIGFSGIPGLPDSAARARLRSFTIGSGVARGFIPDQDQGYLLVNVQLPDAASDERTQEVMARVAKIAQDTPGVHDTFAISGQSFVLSAFGSNFGSMFVILDPFEKRRSSDLYGDTIAAKLRGQFNAKIHDATVAVFGPPPVRGVGTAGGFKFMIEDRGDLGLENLQEMTEILSAAGNKNRDLTGLFGLFRANVPQCYADIDRHQAETMRVPIPDVFDTLQIYLGSLYVNDFNRFGRTWQVLIQAEDRFRAQPEDVGRLQVRNSQGKMARMGSLVTVEEIQGPLLLSRYNMYRASFINGSAAPGVSSGQAIATMEKLAREKLPESMAYEWTEMAFLEQQAGNTGMIVFGFSVAMVFLVLAALYESWSLPLAVILVVPLCLLSAIVGVIVADMDVNIFTQIGFIVLVGLASKNAILIVEYAKVLRENGAPRLEATLQACELRLRPIIMTSFAFILGVLPLLLSTGAGAEMRRTLGTAVFSGMIGVTLFGIFLTPVFFYVTAAWMKESGRRPPASAKRA
ncbi:MAG TPA: multidrug efflux RND transporter permease subunit [Gemmataceae bacterium]|nr:multidrug efflux RND transporter permease subunit [Gemmataceae bacterium]